MVARPAMFHRTFVVVALIAALLAPLFAAAPQARAAVSLKVNFQRPSAVVPAGYVRDYGQPYGPRTDANQGSGLSYGWLSPATGQPLDLATAGTAGPGNGRDRGFSPTLDQRLDTLMHMQADDIAGTFNGAKAEGFWEIALPNDTYEVTVAVGDGAAGTDPERHTLRVEGTVAIQDFVPSGAAGSLTRFKTAVVRVTVADGRLTIDAQGGTNTKINYIDIVTATGSQLQPRVTSVSPSNAATNVARNAGVVAGVFVPNGGLRADSVNDNTVFLTRQSDSTRVAASVNTTGGGDSITLQPSALLDPDTTYIFNVTSGVQDAQGVAMQPFSSTFTTGQSGGATGPTLPVSFQQVRGQATNPYFSSLVIGPDRKLYASSLEGFIYRYDIGANGALSNQQQIATVRASEGNTGRAIIGMAFDPAATAGNLILWVSHNGPYVAQGAEDWTGQISRLSGANLETIQDYVVGLPHSFKDHMVNSIAFRPGESTALYVSVGSNSAMGDPDGAWGQRPERLLSAAVLRVNLAGITTPPLNVKTEEGGSYNPFAPGAPVTIFASGVRNAYDLVWHTNGQLYVPTNGSAAGGNSPATPTPLPAACANRIDSAANGAYTGPAVPALRTVTQIQKDWLFRVVQGGYYGHPNPLRCEWVMNGGNPTAGQNNDGPAEIYEYPAGTQPDRNYRGAAFDFGLNRSPNGAVEYRSNLFGGVLQGKLLVVRYSQGKDIVALEPGGANNDISVAYEGMPGMTGFSNPLDLIEDQTNGNLYVIEFGSGSNSQITLLRPLVGNVAQVQATPAPVFYTDRADATPSGAQVVTVRNVGTADLAISNISIVGAGAAAFAVANTPATSVPQGGSTTIEVTFNPAQAGPAKALLRISSNAANTPTLEIPLRGLGVVGTGGASEPSLQWILDTYDIPVNVGDPDPATNALPTTALLGEEVSLQRFERADNANPVIIEPLAVFGPTSANPVTTFGWYSAGNAAAKSPLFSVGNDPASNGQRISPVLVPGATLTFDPGTQAFGFYSIWPAFSNREVFSEDSLNTFSGAVPHHVRVYPLKDSAGAVVPNAYVVATEETTSGHDYQDVVVVVRNVRAAGSAAQAPAAPVNVAATAGNGQVALSWAAGAGTPPESYRVYRGATASVSTAGAPLATVTGTSYTDAAVANGTTYYYAVVAVTGGQASPRSAVVSAVPQAASGQLELVNLDGVPYNDRLVFNRADCCTSLVFHREATLRLRNTATTPLNVSQLTLGGADASWYQIIGAGNAGPFTIAPGEFRDITFRFVRDQNYTPAPGVDPNTDPNNPGLIRSARNATVTISSSDPANPSQVVALSGWNLPRQGGDNEPRLQDVLDNFGYASRILGPGQSLRGPAGQEGVIQAVGDEVLSGFWLRADASKPSYVRQLLASSRTSAGETFRFGSGPIIRHGGNQYQSYLPLNDQTPPGPTEQFATPSTTTPFEIRVGGVGSNRAFADPTRGHALRFWPLRDRQGELVPNAYILGHDYVGAVGDTSGGANFDFQDNVYLITNIRPANLANDPTIGAPVPGNPALVLPFDNTNYPGTLADAGGRLTGFPQTQRNRDDTLRPDLPPTTSYDSSRLTLNTGGQGTLTIASTGGINSNTTNTLVNGLCLPFDARHTKYQASARLIGPFNFANGFQQAGLMVGFNQDNFIKLVAGVRNGGQARIYMAIERFGAIEDSPPVAEVLFPNQASAQSLDLRLVGDPNTGVVEAFYSINNAAFQRLPGSITLSGVELERFFDKNTKACTIVSNRLASTTVNAVYDRFAVELPADVTADRQVLRRINTGGPTVSAGGFTWTSDKTPVLYTPTNSPDEGGPAVEIANTTLDPIYRTYRGQVPGAAVDQRFLRYEIPLEDPAPQQVSLRLHFAELFWGLEGRQGPNRRLFDVYAEGERVINGFDIFSAAGNAARSAVVVPLENIQVDDGVLSLTFHAILDNTSIGAIELLAPLNNGPVVDAGPDQQVALGASVQLAGQVSGQSPPFTLAWTQVGGPAVTLAGANTLSPSFTAPGSFAVLTFRLSATDSGGLSNSDTVVVRVGDEPIAGLQATSNSPRVVGELVTFGASVTAGDNVTYSWDFGDGATGTGAAPTHTYTQPGSYTATVTASNASGQVSASTTVTILSEPPFELRINAGGPAYTDAQGRAWIADLNNSNPRYSTGNTVFTNNNAVIANGAPNPDIYKTERYGTNFNYNIPVPAADDYLVTLHFAEIYIGAPAPGQPNSTATRRFDVNIIDPVVPAGAEPEIDNLNLRATVGSTTAYSQTFRVRVTDGQINFNLNSQAANGGSDNAKISGVEVVRVINSPPVVDAGPDQTVQVGALAQLNGSVSDPEGGSFTFSWTQTAGPAVTLANPTTLTPSFTPAAKGSYTFRLSASDAEGGTASDTVTITVPNRAPTVTASANPATLDAGQTSTLTATASDPDGDALTYSWAQTGGPAGGTLANASSATASFTPAAGGTYTLRVTVSDGDTGGTATADVTVTANNRAPTVTASASPATVDVGQTSTLTATASDPDGDALTYSWAQTGGPAGGTFTGTDSATASFTPATGGVHTFRVTVSDPNGGTATADVTVTANNRAPVANAGADGTVSVGAEVILDGRGSSDPDGDALSFAWTQTAGAAVTLTGATTDRPRFTAPAAADVLTFQLIVTDSNGAASAPDTVTVTVAEVAIAGLSADSDSPTVLGQPTTFSASVTAGSNVVFTWNFGDGNTATGANVQYTFATAGTRTVTVTATNDLGSEDTTLLVTVTNEAPVADAGASQTVAVSSAVTLDGSASSDPDGHTPLTYAWKQTDGPAVTLTGANTATPSFTAPANPTVLAFALVVTDSTGLPSEPASVLVIVEDTAPQDVTASNDGPTVLGQPTELSATAAGSNLVFTWQLGDGNTATGATVEHTYADEGSYVATVTVTNGSGTVGSASTGVTVTNAAPLANAGPDQEVDLGAAVSLNGAASSDPDGHTPLSYAWTQLSGPAVTLTGATTATPSFTAPNQQTSLVFQLTATDSRGKSATDTVRVVVGDEAIAGLQATGGGPTVLGQPTSFGASVSAGSNVVFSWSFGDGATAIGASVQHVYAAEGSYTVTLTASNAVSSASRTLTVLVTNAAPTASAGADQTVLISSAVSLTATASDPDGHTPLSYSWTQIGGAAVTLSGASTATATFTAPAFETNLVFRLTVTDSRGKSSVDNVAVTVREDVVAPPTFTIFLPMLARNAGGGVATPADLAVSAMTVTPPDMAPGVPAQVSVTVTNQGGSDASAFWVDLYINPDTPPTVASITWETTCTLEPCYGAAWLVEGGLAAGESIVLTLDPASYYAANTRWEGVFAPGTNAIYVYVDSWNETNPNGAIAEADETNNRAERVLPAPPLAKPATAGSRPELPARFIP